MQPNSDKMAMPKNEKILFWIGIAVALLGIGQNMSGIGTSWFGFGMIFAGIVMLLVCLSGLPVISRNVPGMFRLLAVVFFSCASLGLGIPAMDAYMLNKQQSSIPTITAHIPPPVFIESPSQPEAINRSETLNQPKLAKLKDSNSVNLDYVPRVALIYRDKKIEIHNDGRTNLYLWGGAYGDANVPPDKGEPRLIAPTAYYYLFVDKLEDQFHAAIGENGEKIIPFHAFITAEDSHKYTLRGELLGKVVDGVVSVHAQSLRPLDGWIKQPFISDSTQELPDVSIRLVHPKTPGVVAVAMHSLARDIEISPVLWNLDLQTNDSLFVYKTKFEWMRVDQIGAPSPVVHPDDVKSRVKEGNRVLGFITVTCSNCIGVRVYWIYFVYGAGGWYSEITTGGTPDVDKLITALPKIRENVDAFFSSIPASARIPIEGN